MKFLSSFFLPALALFAVRLNTIIGMREDTWEWSVHIGGINFGVWDEKTGGDVDSTQSAYNPGGMARPYGLGGTRTVANLVLRRNYRLGRDHPASQKLIDMAGKATVRAVGQPLDHDGNAWGTPFTYNGVLKRVAFPDHNSQASGPSMVEIEIVIDGYPTGMSR